MFDFLDDVPAMGDVFGGFSTGGMGGGISGFGGGGAAPASGSSFDEVGLGGAGGAPGFDGGGGARGTSGGASPPTQQLDFVANDGSFALDAFAWLTGHDQDRPRTIQEMAASAEAQAGNGNGQVSQIDLVGHGAPNWQSTGRDDETGGSVGANMSDADREAFRRMGATMTPDGEIVFGGCNVAATDDPVMMKQAAAAAGHNVRGGTARQIPFLPGIEGPEVVVMPDGTTRTETNLFKDAYAWADNHVPW